MVARYATIILFLQLLLAACTASTPVAITPVPEAPPKEIPHGTNAAPIQFQKIVVKLPGGYKIGEVDGGLLCLYQRDLTYGGGRREFSESEFTDVFKRELTKANYPIVGDSDSLFEDPTTWKAELVVAGLVTELHENTCFPLAGVRNFDTSKGDASIGRMANFQPPRTKSRPESRDPRKREHPDGGFTRRAECTV